MKRLEIQGHEVIPASDPLTEKLIEVKFDSVNWRVYLTDQKNNFIRCYPYSEYHGGGPSYFVNIGNYEFESWVLKHPNFESEVRNILDK
ncbi:hypothetical protein [Echinicola salinicaeni]|uniref:hypothetical protein n=1 Tax=Echinicola salinicaeni TaxID=2762757 RepID=UPI001645E7CF|nr:hypothetical protein [Echinicola salinicaeni]